MTQCRATSRVISYEIEAHTKVARSAQGANSCVSSELEWRQSEQNEILDAPMKRRQHGAERMKRSCDDAMMLKRGTTRPTSSK
jgi:hypothetical protein